MVVQLYYHNRNKESERMLYEQWLVYYGAYIQSDTKKKFVNFVEYKKNREKQPEADWKAVDKSTDEARKKLGRKRGRKRGNKSI